MQIVFLDSDTMPEPLPVPEWVTQWVNCPATEPDEEAIVGALAQADICITNKVKLGANVGHAPGNYHAARALGCKACIKNAYHA